MTEKLMHALVGQTLTKITRKGDTELIFECVSGDRYRMDHEQDCCESVLIDDVCGDLDDLIGSPLLVAEERSEVGKEGGEGSSTWTYYTFRTLKGTVDIRWFGTSNGLYSECVNFYKLKR